MTKRKSDNFEETLREFSTSFKKRINEDIRFWKHQDLNHTKGRAMAYSACLSELKSALENNDLTLSDVGLSDYSVPEAGDSNEN